MQRRSFLKTLPAAIAGSFVYRSAKGEPVQSARTFRLTPPKSEMQRAIQIQDALAYKEGIYYLAQVGNTELGGSYAIGCSSLAGEMAWQRQLPTGLYAGIGVAENGDLLVASVSRLRKGDPIRSIYSVAPGDSNSAELKWLTAVPKDSKATETGTILSGPGVFLTGSHFGSVSMGTTPDGIAVATTLANALQGSSPTTTFLPLPAPRFFDVLETKGGILILNKETAEVDSIPDSTSAATTRYALSGGSVSFVKAALAVTMGEAKSLNGGMALVSASGIVNDSLHVLLVPYEKGKAVATYAWCDSDFKIIGAKEFDLQPYMRSGSPQRLTQIGTETAVIFTDGTVVAFPTPS